MTWLAVRLLALVCALALGGCEREMRRFTTPEANTSPTENADRASTLQPAIALTGGVRTAVKNVSPYDDNAYAVNQGKRLYRWYNCGGCHGLGGGGGMGPALMDSEWRYGSDPASIFATITQGRPNGMPSFGGHIPDDQVWQLVAYVRSMSGLLRKDVAPSRGDMMQAGPAENARDKASPRPEKPPSPTPPGAPR
ncbi:c-type cytochrome [Ramlibacter sp.]|uniref:c-type cytochrome n=1 Tax=Ramlibacter sp. TaxID=1917967 RepID=UPI002CDC8985|nr:c-type cytochrome [Ramlibacter sp.]HWI80491.1 c-type cytochrome [Ramlibacter sp.]